MTEPALRSRSTACVWCGYDTDAPDAALCAECGAALSDRALLEPWIDWAETSLFLSIVAMPVTGLGISGVSGMRFPSLESIIVFCMVLGGVTICAVRAAKICPRLQKDGRRHSRWMIARIAMYLFLLQTLVLWAVMLGLIAHAQSL